MKSKRREELLHLISPDDRDSISLRPVKEWRDKTQHLPSKDEDREDDVELKLP